MSSWFIEGFIVRDANGDWLSANDENYSSEEGNALELSQHFSVFITQEDAKDFITATTKFRLLKGYASLGPYVIGSVEVVEVYPE